MSGASARTGPRAGVTPPVGSRLDRAGERSEYPVGMETAQATIPARSRREAMDWALVLISQGIESTINRAEESGSWSLAVAAESEAAAREAIHLYRIENRRWWRKEVESVGVLFDWAAAGWAAGELAFFWASGQPGLKAAGAVDSVAVATGEIWRLFTAVWLHADAGHLAMNLAFGVVLMALVLGRYGTGIGLLAALLCGAGGNAISMALAEAPHRSLGASGLVMGCLGLLTIPEWSSRWRVWSRRGVAALGAGVMLFVLTGVSPGTDVRAHLGGFATGLALGLALSAAPDLSRRTWPNLAAGVVFLVLTLWPWWLALAGAA